MKTKRLDCRIMYPAMTRQGLSKNNDAYISSVEMPKYLKVLRVASCGIIATAKCRIGKHAIINIH